MPEQPIRPQVLVGDMPELVRDLVRETLEGVDVEIVPDETAFRPTQPGWPPPIVIVAYARTGTARGSATGSGSTPEAVILGVERHGRTLAVSMLDRDAGTRSS